MQFCSPISAVGRSSPNPYAACGTLTAVRGTAIEEGKPERRDGDSATDVRDADGSRGDPNSAAVTVEDDEIVRGTEIDEGETAEPADRNAQTDPRDADGDRPKNPVLGDG